MLKSCVKTYSGVYTGYIVRHGIQEILFTCQSSSEADKLCKEFSATYSGIYVEQVFTAHTTYRYRSDVELDSSNYYVYDGVCYPRVKPRKTH